MPLDRLPNQRAILDRRALAEAIAEAVARDGAKARPAIVGLLREALAAGRAELARRLALHPTAGHDCTRGHASRVDQLVRVIHDHVIEDVYPLGNRSTGERRAQQHNNRRARLGALLGHRGGNRLGERAPVEDRALVGEAV